jgi:hypothetical protein
MHNKNGEIASSSLNLKTYQHLVAYDKNGLLAHDSKILSDDSIWTFSHISKGFGGADVFKSRVSTIINIGIADYLSKDIRYPIFSNSKNYYISNLLRADARKILCNCLE